VGGSLVDFVAMANACDEIIAGYQAMERKLEALDQYRRRIRAARRALERQQDQPVQAAVHADRCLKLLAETVTKMRDVITDFAAGVATGVVKR
jgi:hypothetical protein